MEQNTTLRKQVSDLTAQHQQQVSSRSSGAHLKVGGSLLDWKLNIVALVFCFFFLQRHPGSLSLNRVLCPAVKRLKVWSRRLNRTRYVWVKDYLKKIQTSRCVCGPPEGLLFSPYRTLSSIWWTRPETSAVSWTRRSLTCREKSKTSRYFLWLMLFFFFFFKSVRECLEFYLNFSSRPSVMMPAWRGRKWRSKTLRWR